MTDVSKVIFELLTRCDARCPGCYMDERLDGSAMEFDINTFVQVLDLTNPNQVDLLGGEPLLWEPLKKAIEILDQRSITTYLFSNFMNIDRTLGEFLLDKGVYLTGKMNIADPSNQSQLELQAQMIGIKNMDKVRKIFENIEMLTEIGFKQPYFSIENLLRKENIEYAPEFAKWCLDRDIRPDLELPACYDPSDKEYFERIPTPKQIAQLIQDVKEVYDGELLPPHITARCTYSGVPPTTGAMYFRPNGDIQACSGNKTILANFLEDENPIEKAKQSEVVQTRINLTQDMITEGSCKICYKWDDCGGGCRATVENLGNKFGSDPRCWYKELTIE